MAEEEVNIHRAALFENEAYVVTCMAVDELQGILAVARRADYG